MSRTVLHISAPDEGTRIEVLDPALRPMALTYNTGEAELEVDPGLYAVRFRRGLAVTEKLTLISKNDKFIRVTLDADEEPIFATAAPVQQAGEQPSAQQNAAERLSREVPHIVGTPADTRGRLLLFFRCDDASSVRLDAGLTLHRESGEELVRIEELAQADSSEGWAGLHLELAAGAYRLRRKLEAASLEQILYVRPRWQTQFFAKVLPQEKAATVDYALRSIMMAQTDSGFSGGTPDARYAEAALRALRESGSIPGPMSAYMLDGKFANPLLGILAALLQLRRADLDVAAFGTVLDNLLMLMGGVPDVLAMGLGLMNRDPRLRENDRMRERFCVPAILGQPPYFSDSWRHIVAASEWNPELIPEQSLAARAAISLVGTTPWFRWRTTNEPAVATPPQTALKEGKSIWANIATSTLNLIGITPQSITDFTAKTLSLLLKSIQDSLGRFDDVAELLAADTFTHLDRRIGGFVYPFTDAPLMAFFDGLKDHGTSLRESVLARGRDSKELSRVMQLPLLTAIIQAMSLLGKLSACQREAQPEERVNKFIEQESHGHGGLRQALQSLAAISTSVRHTGTSHAVDLLEYLVLHYDAAARKQALKLPFIQISTSQPIGAALNRQIMNEARARLGSKVAGLNPTGAMPGSFATEAPAVIADLEAYQPGKLFLGFQWPPPQNKTPWARIWRIVRSDLDIAHVMSPLTDFTLQKANGQSQAPGYELIQNEAAAGADLFAGVRLSPRGTRAPSFSDITGLPLLPMFSEATSGQYVQVSDMMSDYLTQNPDVERLEGVVRIPCHSPITPEAPHDHPPLFIKTIIQFYQFSNVVEADSALLVVRAPLSPLCPANGNGMALGIGRVET
jgi:hypothetical protein